MTPSFIYDESKHKRFLFFCFIFKILNDIICSKYLWIIEVIYDSHRINMDGHCLVPVFILMKFEDILLNYDARSKVGNHNFPT